MNWLFETSIFTARVNCGYWERWMIHASILSNLCFVFTYTIIPIALVFFHMYRGNSFSFPKYMTFFIVFFMGITCVTRLNTVASYTWPAQRFFVICEILSGISALIVGCAMPYIVNLAAHAPTIHRMRNLEHNNELYKKLDDVVLSQTKLTHQIVLNKIKSKVDKKTLGDVQEIMDTLVQR